MNPSDFLPTHSYPCFSVAGCIPLHRLTNRQRGLRRGHKWHPKRRYAHTHLRRKEALPLSTHRYCIKRAWSYASIHPSIIPIASCVPIPSTRRRINQGRHTYNHWFKSLISECVAGLTRFVSQETFRTCSLQTKRSFLRFGRSYCRGLCEFYLGKFLLSESSASP